MRCTGHERRLGLLGEGAVLVRSRRAGQVARVPRRLRARHALVGGLAFAVHLPRTVPVLHATAATGSTVGVTRRTVTVAGLVGADAASTGADIGAQARFARANRRGGVAGRTVEYSGNAADVASAASTAFAVVP